MEPNNMGGMVKHSMNCPCPHHKVVPVSIILIGLVALAGTLGWLDMHVVGIIWPLLLVVIGAMKLFGKNCKCCQAK